MAFIFSKPTKAIGAARLACAWFLLAPGYRDFHPMFRPTCGLFGVLGVRPVGAAMMGRRHLRDQPTMGEDHR